jgi:lauroyl/myristoyl acyltransferase
MWRNTTSDSELLRFGDVRRVMTLAAGGLVAACIPETASPAIARFLQRLYPFVLPGTVRSLQSKMQVALQTGPGLPASEIVDAHILMRLEDMWARLRGVRRFGWNPRIEWEGLDRLRASRQDGRGTVIWCMRFSSATVIKQAFYREQMPLVHLSRFDHGSATTTKLGLQIAAPLYCRAENCYLKERVSIPQNGSMAYIATLRARLRAGECVSIFGEHSGLQDFASNILGTQVKLALGAPSLAWLENATLFTAAPIRIGPFHYRIVIDEEIPVDRALPRRSFATAAAQQYADRLTARILQHPADWQGWLYRDFETAPDQC